MAGFTPPTSRARAGRSSSASIGSLGRRAPGNRRRPAGDAATVETTGGAYLVPAFVGLGAPYRDAHARGALVGLTRETGLAEIARAAIDAMAYQVADVVAAMAADAGVPLHVETTALGAAAVAGLAVGFWSDPVAFAANRSCGAGIAPWSGPAAGSSPTPDDARPPGPAAPWARGEGWQERSLECRR